jgi:hypothetical protein
MHEERYTKIENNWNYRVFTFISQGRHGDLVKIVTFEELVTINNAFNLSLGTILPNGEIDFDSITNNGDRNKVLATVARTIYVFIEKHPDKDVYITGSDNRRTMLYKRAIVFGYDELIENFDVFGDTSNDEESHKFEPFDNSKNYSGFLIKRK